MSDGREGQTPRAPAASVVTTVAVVAVVVGVLLVALWAASSGPDDPLRGDGNTPERIRTEQPSDTPTPLDRRAGDGDDDERDGGGNLLAVVVGVVIAAVGVLLALGALYLLATALWRLRTLRWHRRDREEAPPPLDPVQAVAAAMVSDAEDHQDLLRTGTPRNAVVESWHRFELQAARAGVPREEWETSAEFTLRLLGLVEADASSVARLAELYREARFSEHELGEDSREAALAIVRSIHRDLRTLLSGGRR